MNFNYKKEMTLKPIIFIKKKSNLNSEESIDSTLAVCTAITSTIKQKFILCCIVRSQHLWQLTVKYLHAFDKEFENLLGC
jgi:hypothetical protein